MAESFYGATPDAIQRECLRRLDAPLRTEVVAFAREYGVPLYADASARS